MNKFVTTAVGLIAVGSINSADPSDNDWLGLDSEIKSISSSIASNDNGIGMAALLRFNYALASDDISTGGAPLAPDVSGFRFDDIDLAFWTNIGDYTMRVSMDLAGRSGRNTGSFELQDAFIAWHCPSDIEVAAGRMNPTFMHDGNVLPDDLFFMDRTAIGSALYHYDEGLQVAGMVQDIAWFFGIFNGSSYENADHGIFIRLAYMLGEGDGGHEGSHEKAAGTNLTFGLGISEDNTVNGDTLNTGIDIHGNHDRFGFDFSYLMIDDDFIGANALGTEAGLGVLAAPFALMGDSSPMALAVTYSVNADWSVGLRMENLDNDTGVGAPDNDLLTLGANYYGANGARWSANYTDVGADGVNPDGSYFQIGYTVGFSE